MSSGSSYLDHLPAVMRSGDFLGRFLLAFEAVFTGREEGERIPGEPAGLEQKVAGLADCFDPLAAPAEFLPWLARWVALTLRADWDVDTQRGFLQEIVPLYRLRGTLAGLRRMLEIYLHQLGSEIGGDDVTIVDQVGDLPHFFEVRLVLGDTDADRLRATQETAAAIIDQEKPAHTFYALKVVVPTMRLLSEELAATLRPPGQILILGRNTRLGTSG